MLHMDHITNPNKENAIRTPRADFAFIPEAEASVIENTDDKFHNVDVYLEGGGAEARRVDQINPSTQLDRPVQFIHQDSGYILPSLSKQRFSGCMKEVDPF